MTDPASTAIALAVLAEMRWAIARLDRRVGAIENDHRPKKGRGVGAVRAVVWLGAAALLLAGCAGSRQEHVQQVRKERMSVAGTVAVPTAEGVRSLPVSLTIDRTGTDYQTTEERTTSGPDGAEIGRGVAAALAPALAVSTGGASAWLPLVQTAAAAIGTGGIAYLAHKKRQQLKGKSA